MFFTFLIFIINLSYSSFEKDNASLIRPGALNHEFECHKWNATIFPKKDSIQKLLQATFKPFSGYERCFTFFIVYLFLLKPNHYECNLSDGMEIDFKRVQLNNQRKDGSYKVSFTDLQPKYYCLMIKPCAERCYETMLSSSVLRIEEAQTAKAKQNVTRENIQSTRSDIPYISVISISTFIIGIILYWNYKHRRKVRKIPESIVERGEIPFLKPSDTEVFILYYSDGISQKLVDCLADFLRECAEFNVTVIDDRHAPIHFEPYSWLDEHLQCCSTVDGKCNCNRRVIVVMTEWVINYMRSKRKVVKRLNEMSKIENESCAIPLCSAVFDDMQSDWFCYGLDKILIDWSKCMKDYTHFFVIYFNETLYDEGDDAITIAPDVRFSIQRHLVKLCQEMNNSFKDITQKEKLIKCLEMSHPIKDIISIPNSHTS